MGAVMTFFKKKNEGSADLQEKPLEEVLAQKILSAEGWKRRILKEAARKKK